MDCEVCGARQARRKAKIEGIVLTVCDKCAGLGKEVPAIKKVKAKGPARLPEEMEQALVHDFAAAIRKRREAAGLTQEKFAARLGLNPNIIRRIEGGWEPPLAVARKIEKQLKLRLIEHAPPGGNTGRPKGKGLTIGDIIKLEEEEE